MGEVLAWIIGWNLILEYLFAAGTVAVGWSGYVVSLVEQLGFHLPAALTSAPFAKGAGHLEIVRTGAIINLPAVLVIAAITALCYVGIHQSARFNAIVVAIKVAVINNGNLGMVRQWQNLFYSQRYSNTDLGTHKHRIPDFKLLAEAMGCVGLRCETREDVDKVINEAMAINDRPVVIDFVVSRDSMVWPMVPQGVSNSSIEYAQALAPTWDDEDADMTGETA